MTGKWYTALEEPYYRLHVPKEDFADHPPEAQKYPLPPDVRSIQKKRLGRRYMFTPGVLLFRERNVDAELERVLAEKGATSYRETPPDGDSELDRRERARVDAAQRAKDQSGLVSYRLSDAENREPADDVPAIVQELRRRSESWNPWPQFVLGIQQDAEYGPALPPSEPLPVGLELAPPTDGPGAGIVVAVIDTGARADHVLLAGHVRIRGDIDLEVVDESPADGQRDYVAGHGTHVAGIIRQLAPGATILARATVRSNGTVSDPVVAGAIDELAQEDTLDILNLSFGGYAHDGFVTGLPCTTDALRRLRLKHPRVIVVAAAGNNRKTEAFFPAALPDVIGVGATDERGNRAWFSNRGPWVDTWALGVGVASSYIGPSLTELGGGGRDLGATVKWTGTSFAAPRVAGTLAAAMAP